jgi:hypothetical protein
MPASHANPSASGTSRRRNIMGADSNNVIASQISGGSEDRRYS